MTSSHLIPGISRAASYKTAAQQRERRRVLTLVQQWIERVDPTGQLIARPVDNEGWRRLVEKRITHSRQAVRDGEDELESAPQMRPVLIKSRAHRACMFIERYCLVPEGPGAGQLMVLDEFERRFIYDVLDNPDITQLALLSMAKKNGKTAVIAAIVLVFTIGPEARLNSQIVSGAMERDQAAIIFKYALKMAEASPVLQLLLRPVASHKRFFGLARNVEFRALANVAASTHGISPYVAILDEIGQVEGDTSEFVNAIVTAQGAYDDALLVVISTQAPDDTDLLSQMIDSARGNGAKRINGDDIATKSADGHTICHLYTAPPGCDVLDKEAWRISNPALGTFRSITDMEKLALKAKQLPSFASSFRNLNLNQRDTGEKQFVPSVIWEANGREPDDLDGQLIYGGLDLSEVADLTSFVAVTTNGDVHPYFWLPEEGLEAKAKEDGVPYDRWRDSGLLLTTPGPTVEYKHIVEFLRGVFDRCSVVKIGFDKWNWNSFRQWLLHEDHFTKEEVEQHFVPFQQGFISMSPALRELESKLLNKMLQHGNNEILTWCAKNALIERDAAGNRKFTKKNHASTKRIDGMVALAMAVGVMPNSSGGHADEPEFQMFVL